MPYLGMLSTRERRADNDYKRWKVKVHECAWASSGMASGIGPFVTSTSSSKADINTKAYESAYDTIAISCNGCVISGDAFLFSYCALRSVC